ncbi:leucine-rich repeat flightless-interacting protein 2 isoform X7 [Corythoichthys intestinalis]|uniref:leucine-rich repeat flightless-interacting protein 2 isoform X7 n=1 Tax=Corythoichthys intestinalis TaxID=161448 RepID=UPI0025A59C0F|nr:leucine-rich repeat flightless-interacting protein 2 isoform X7 [Corythoichthys intestinalis]
MGTQGPGRKRLPNLDKLTAEDDALQKIAREAEVRLAARRAARAEAREIRMKDLERQHKEKYYGVDYKWGHIEQWMEEGERYSRHSRRIASLSDDEERMSVGSRGSLKPSDYSSFLGSCSRASSRASSARASPVVEERLDRDFLDKGSRTALNLSAATLSSLGGASSRRGSCDTSVSIEMEASMREMKDSVAEAEEKYRRAMVSNAQLHNDKSTLMYQVETLREELSDMEELLWEARRHSDECTKAYERERECHIVLQFQFKEMEETMKRSEELLMKYGEVISPEVATNGGLRSEDAEDEFDNSFASRLAVEAPGSRESMLELRLKKLIEERESFQDQVRMLRKQLLLSQRNGSDGSQNREENRLENGTDSYVMDTQRDANRQISELKFKLVKSEQEVNTLEQSIIRLEGQVTRYRTASETAELVEDELKVEKRKLQRELRSALDRIQELESTNGLLAKRLEKMKATRSVLQSQQ